MGFRSLILSVICLMLAVGALVWCLLSGWYWPAGGAGAVTAVLVYRVLSIYGSNVRKLNYLLSAVLPFCRELHISPGPGLQHPAQQGEGLRLRAAAA